MNNVPNPYKVGAWHIIADDDSGNIKKKLRGLGGCWNEGVRESVPEEVKLGMCTCTLLPFPKMRRTKKQIGEEMRWDVMF